MPPSTERKATRASNRGGDLQKRLSGGGGAGIDFNKLNDSDVTGAVSDYLTVHIVGTGAGSGDQIDPAAVSIINAADAGGFELVNETAGKIGMYQLGDGGMTLANNGAGDTLVLVDGGGNLSFYCNTGYVVLGTTDSGSDLTFFVKDGDIFWLQGGDAGTPIMALKWNGALYDLHLQTGATVVYDL